MKSTAIRLATAFVVLVLIPIFYNACQSSPSASNSNSSAATCKLALENGQLKKIKTYTNAPPAGFASAKAQLHSGVRKAGAAPVKVASGTSLGVILDNNCLQNNPDTLATTPITNSALRSGLPIPQLDRQVYLWTTEQERNEDEIESLAQQEPCVLGVSWNRKYTIQSFNDPDYSQQTQLPSMHADQAYARFYGAAGAMATTGTSIILAVVDTGVNWSHPDLQANMWQHTLGYGIDITTLSSSQISYNPEDISPIGHGTNVAGIIAAVTDNGVGVVGTMPYRAKIMAIKIFSADSTGDLSTSSQYFYNGIRFAYLNGANVINMSVGSVTSGSASDALTQSAITDAVAQGSVAVVVIGNADSGNGGLVDGSSLSSIPGQYATAAGVIGVGSIDAQTGTKSYFSNYSTTYAEIGAPGAINSNTGILSTIPVAQGSYGSLMGTSQAAPAVSAAAGLTMGLIRDAYGILPTPAEVERLMLLAAIKNPQLTGYFQNGNQLDLLNLVNTINLNYPNTGAATGGATYSPSCD